MLCNVALSFESVNAFLKVTVQSREATEQHFPLFLLNTLFKIKETLSVTRPHSKAIYYTSNV